MYITSPDTTKQSLSDIAYVRIKAALVDLQFGPGSAITEMQLMEKLGMSRTPVRQALHRLEQEGLVKLLPRKGWFVAGVSLRDIQEIFVIREALEGIAARLAAERMTDAQLQELKDYMDKVKPAEGQETIDPGDILHQRIFEVVENAQMNRVLNLYDDQLRRFHVMASRLPGRALLSYREHYDILAAMIEREAEKAERLMREHIRSSKSSILEAVINNTYGDSFEC